MEWKECVADAQWKELVNSKIEFTKLPNVTVKKKEEDLDGNN
jgi:hypothetical protein